MKHPDLKPIFIYHASRWKIWKKAPSTLHCYLNSIPHRQFMSNVSSQVKLKPEKSLKNFISVFQHSDIFVDFYTNKILVSQGLIFNYIACTYDLIILKNNNGRMSCIKIKDQYYHRNSVLTVYITSEFITENRKVFDLVLNTISHLSIKIVSREQLKHIVHGE